MKEPRTIRYFSNEEKANNACKLLKDVGFECYVSEDKFGTITLDKLGFPLRFRLYVEREDIKKIAEFLAKRIKR